MTKLIKYLKHKQIDDLEKKEQTGEVRAVDPKVRERSMEWRHVITSDPDYAYHKKMLFQEKSKSSDKLSEFKRNRDPWVHKLIMSQSTYKQN